VAAKERQKFLQQEKMKAALPSKKGASSSSSSFSERRLFCSNFR
jgi:hypothetical protein